MCFFKLSVKTFLFFQKGDVVECQIEQLGSIINKVV